MTLGLHHGVSVSLLVKTVAMMIPTMGLWLGLNDMMYIKLVLTTWHVGDT